MHFSIGYKPHGKADRVVIDADDALKAKAEQPDAVITYVRPQNRRGDARHPSHGFAEGLQ
jgi:hypothetical protein